MEWRTIFSDDGGKKTIPIGQRLGVPYTRTLLPELEIEIMNASLGMVDPARVTIDQDGMGMIGISGVIWDCGLYMADFLSSAHIMQAPISMSSSPDMNEVLSNLMTISLVSVLDIGCGTGICGVVAAKLGAKQVVFTDSVFTDAFEFNLDTIKNDSSATCSETDSSPKPVFDAVKYRWSENASEEIPQLLTYGCKSQPSENINDSNPICWETVLCSDVLYEKSCLPALQLLLKRLHFRKLVLAYKKRHDEPERIFLEELSTWCHLLIVPKDEIISRNLPANNVDENLFILIAVPHADQISNRGI